MKADATRTDAQVQPPSPAELVGRRANWRRWALGVVAGVLLWFLVSRFAEIETVARSLERGQWQWLLVAAVLQILCYTLYALNYHHAFAAAGIQSPAYELLPVLLASLAVGEVAPMGWAAGSAVVIQYAIGRGHPPERSAIGTLLAQACDLLTFSFTFALGMLFLFIQHDLRPYEIGGAIALLTMNAALLGFLALSLWKPGWLFVLLRWSPRATAFTRTSAEQLQHIALEVSAHPRNAINAPACALGAHCANISSLFVVFHAFGQPIAPGALIAGYGIGILAWMVSPVPSGIGVVEGTIALVYTSLGVPASSAAVIAVAYRGLSFWLPFIAGLLCLRKLRARTTVAQM